MRSYKKSLVLLNTPKLLIKNVLFNTLFLYLAIFLINFENGKSQIVDVFSDPTNNYYLNSKLLFDRGLIHYSELEVVRSLQKYDNSSATDKLRYLQHNLAITENNYKLAETKIDNFISQRDNSPYLPFVFYQKSLINFELDNMEQAEISFKETYNNAIKNYNQRKDSIYLELAHKSLYWRGVALSYYGKNIESEETFELCSKEYPEGQFADDALFALAQINENKQEYETAISLYKLIRTKYPKSNLYISTLIREANNHLMLRNYNSALLTLERAETIFISIANQDSVGIDYENQTYSENHRENITYLRGEANNQAGNYANALKYYVAFLETYYNSPLINHIRLGAGWSNLNLNNYEEALKYYDLVIKNSNNKDWNAKSIAQLYRAICLRKLDKNESAVKELVALSTENSYPLLGQVLLELGQYYYEIKDYENAKKYLEKGDQEAIDPVTTTRIYIMLGATYMALNLNEKAINVYNKAEQLAKNSSEIIMPQKQWYLSEIAFKNGIALIKNQKNSEAIPYINQFLSNTKDEERKEEAMFWLAEAYYNLSLLNNSILIYTKLLDDYPNSKRREEIIYGLGWSYFRLQKFKESSRVFGDLVEEFPKTKYGVEVFTRQGDGYYLLKNYPKAIASYTKALKLGPNTEEGQYSAYQLCHALYQSNKYEQAITSLLNFISQYRKSTLAPNATYLIGWIRFLQRRYAEAIDNFTFLIESYPQSIHIPRAYYAIADCQYNLQQFEKAMNSYKIVVENYPSHQLAPEAMRGVQQCLILLGREEEAIEIINNYTDKNVDSPFYRDFKQKAATILFENRKYKDAITEYEKIIEKTPNNSKNAEAYYWMGKSYVSMTNYEDAKKSFRIITEKYKDSEFAPLSLFEIGLTEKKQGLNNLADSVFNSVYVNFPKSGVAPQAQFERAILFYQIGDTVKSMQTYRFVADSFATSDFGIESRYRLGKFYRNNNKNNEAIEEFRILSENLINKELAAEAQYRIGELFRKDDKLNEAIIAFETVRVKFENFEDWFSLSLLGLGEIYEQLENYSKAREVYTVLEELRSADDFGKTAKKRLQRIKNR